MDESARDFEVIDDRESPEWKAVIGQFIEHCCEAGQMKFNHYRSSKLISDREFVELSSWLERERIYLLVQPLSTRADYIRITGLCRDYADQVIAYKPDQKGPKVIDLTMSKN